MGVLTSLAFKGSEPLAVCGLLNNERFDCVLISLVYGALVD